MQGLWSRAAQTRSSCRCTSCASAIARRTTTAATKRRLKIGDLFTACYSTILASAAIADAKIKEERRKEWDRVIAQAQAGLPICEPDPIRCTNAMPQVPSPKQPSWGESLIEDREPQRGSKQAGTVLSSISWTATKDTPLESKLRSLNRQIRPSLRSPTIVVVKDEIMPLKQPDNDLEDEWIEEEPISGIPFREPKTRVHLDKVQISIANLVDQLLLKTKASSCQKIEGASNLTSEMRDMTQRIDQLRNAFNPFPIYVWDGRITVEEKRCDLHRSLRSICKTTTRDRANIDLMLAKICYNLLISAAPPSIVTYNILIHELSRLNQHHIAQIVIDSFLYNTKFTPTSKTVCVILDHYTAVRDLEGFNSIVRRMRGTDGDLRVKERKLHELRDPKVQQWALQNKVIHREDSLRAKIPRDSGIFDSLINGYLKMRGARGAVRYIRTALRENQQIRGETFCAVVMACKAEVDYRAAFRLLEAIVSLWRGGEATALVELSSTVRYGIHQLLALCCTDSSLTTLHLLPGHLSHEGLHTLLRYMRMESLNNALDLVAKHMLALGSALGMDRSAAVGPLDSPNLNKALKILSRLSQAKTTLILKRQGCDSQARWIKLRVLDSRLTTSGERYMATEKELLSVMYNGLSVLGREMYDTRSGSADNLDFLLQLVQQERKQLRIVSDHQPSQTGTGSASKLERFDAEVEYGQSDPSPSLPQQIGASSLALQTQALAPVTLGHPNRAPRHKARGCVVPKEHLSSASSPHPAITLPFNKRVEAEAVAG